MVDLAEGQVVRRVPLAEGHAEQPQALSDDGRWLANGIDESIHLHDLHRPDAVPAVFRSRFYQFNALAFSADGSRLAAGNHDATVRIFRVPGLSVEHVLRGHYFDTPAVAFSPDGGTVVSLGSREGVRFWRMDSGREAGFLMEPEAQHHLSLAPDGTSILVEKPDGFDVLKTKR